MGEVCIYIYISCRMMIVVTKIMSSQQGASERDQSSRSRRLGWGYVGEETCYFQKERGRETRPENYFR